jgi:hypothetical protein
MAEWPRATQILKDFNFIQDAWYFEPKHRRRGRLVDAACNLLGAGHEIEKDWWGRTSGERDDDRVAHEECRPFIEAYMQFLRETGFRIKHCALEVKNSACRYIGHIDQIGDIPSQSRNWPLSLIDIKTGGESDWHKYQLGLYIPAVNETLETFSQRRYNLYLTNDGKHRLVERKDRRDISEALILAQAWHLTFGRNGNGR